MFPRRAVLLAMLLLAALPAAASPPRLATATPDLGESAVDPTLSELRIEFDQDMDTRGGRSLCGGGPTFPNITDKPRWESARILIIPVKLEPSHTYELSINCPTAQGFHSAASEAAAITPLSFTTAATKKASKSSTLTPQENEKAIAALRQALADRYSHRDVRMVDWDTQVGAHLGELQHAKTRGQFARSLASLLAVSRDVHLSIGVGPARISTFSPMQPPNCNLRWLAANVSQWKAENPVVSTGLLKGGIAYLLIASWPGDANAVQPALDFIAAQQDAPGLIIDVRPNGGGDELTARRLASWFIDKPATYSRNTYRDPASPTGWSPVLNRTIEPTKDGPHYAGPVAVLMGPSCMSSNESFLLMMRTSPRVKLVGEPSYGASANPKPIDLGNGVTIFMPSWKDMLPDGTPLEGRGVLPDLSIRARPDELAASDPVLEAGQRAVAAPPAR